MSWSRRALLAAGAGLPLVGCAGRRPAAPAATQSGAADAIVAAIRRTGFKPRRFDITSHGAAEGGHSDALPAIRAAIAACHDAGGGRVVVPAGLWRVDGPIHLKSNVDFHVAEGAVVRFSGDPRFYLPQVLTRWEGTELWNYSPFIYARGASNVALTGSGTFDGQGKANFLPWRAKEIPARDRLRKMGSEGTPVSERVFGEGDWLRPAFVQFFDCRQVLIDGPSFRDSPFWVLHPVYCTDVVVRGVSVYSKHINSDGCDIDSCTNVLVEQCRFDVNDDCVVVKSGRDQDGWRVARPSSRVVVRDCDMRTDIAGAFAIGSEMSGGAHDIHVERLRISYADYGLFFKANLDRGGVVERIYVRDIDIADCEVPIFFSTDYHGWRGGNFPPTYRNFDVADLRCAKALKALHIVGVPAIPVQNIHLSRVRIDNAGKGPQMAHTRGLVFDDVRVNGEPLAAPV